MSFFAPSVARVVHFAIIALCLVTAHNATALHTRIYACVLANDTAGAFMGGSSNGSGLFISDDTGLTWRHVGWENVKCYAAAIGPGSDGRTIYLATGLGVLRSSDAGVSWRQLTDWRVSEAMKIRIELNDPNTIDIETAHGPWRSSDGGRIWKPLSAPISSWIGPRAGRVTVGAEGPASPVTIEASLRMGVLRNGQVTLPHRQVWSVTASEVAQ